MAKKKLKKKFITSIIGAVLFIISAFLIVLSTKKITTAYQLRVEVNEAKKQLELLQKENEYLINQKEKLNDDEYVSSWARGKYNLTKQGEEVFQLPSTN